MRMRAQDAQLLHGLDKVYAVIVMLLNPRCHRKDIGVKDDVFGWKRDAEQQIISAFANLYLALLRIGLAGFVERHDNDRRAVSHAQTRMM